jgi:hypothetical protein
MYLLLDKHKLKITEKKSYNFIGLDLIDYLVNGC